MMVIDMELARARRYRVAQMKQEEVRKKMRSESLARYEQRMQLLELSQIFAATVVVGISALMLAGLLYWGL